MTFSKLAFLALIMLAAAAASSAQQKFPMQPGEWEATTSIPGPNGKPAVLLYCLNDDTWDKALIHNPACTTQNLVLNGGGATYVMDCQHGTIETKGRVTITFDGRKHMVTKDSIDTITNGQTSNKAYSVDYRWKGPTCDPNADMNLKFKPR
jgi:hypothetical protein